MIDLCSSCHKLGVRGDDIPKRAFRTRYNLYDFVVMSFELTNYPVATMDLTNSVLGNTYTCLSFFYQMYLDLLNDL